MKKIPFFIIFFLISCNSTKIISTWSIPNKDIKISNFKKILIVALLKNETDQHMAEDQLSKYFNGKGLQSYNYFKSNFNKNNEEAIRAKIKKDGFEGAITLRLIDVDKEKIYSPNQANFYPDYYHNFTGYYFNRWDFNGSQSSYITTKTFTIETIVFSIKEDKIIWSALTETTSATGLMNLTEEVTKTIYKQMIKDKLVN